MKVGAIVLAAFIGLSHVMGQTKAEHMGIGKAKFGVQEYQSALYHFRAAIDIDANCAEAYYWSGRTQFLIGDLERAGADLRRALKLDPAFMKAQLYAKERKQLEQYSSYFSPLTLTKNEKQH